ncbi:MAG: hypothetical protein KF901_05815 [Myxococcales bacterium]|nr:hypothetical protein [Myxococcales bacterium]
MRVTFLAVVLFSLCFASVGRAQDPSASEMAAARQLFRSGLGHAEAGRWEEARADFERSYALVAVPVTLFNLAGAQAETGRLVAAAESYRRFLVEATSGRATRFRAPAQRALADIEPRIPSIRLSVVGLSELDELRVDDATVSRAMLGVAYPLDPGEHRVQVLRDGAVAAETSVRLTDGEQRELELDARRTLVNVTPRDAASADVMEAPAGEFPIEAPRERRSVVRSPWLWIGIGAVVVAGAVVGVVLATRDRAEQPYQGNAGVIRFELRSGE